MGTGTTCPPRRAIWEKPCGIRGDTFIYALKTAITTLLSTNRHSPHLFYSWSIYYMPYLLRGL